MHIRPFLPTDAAVLSTVFHDAVHGVGAHYYTPDQVNAWSAGPGPPDRFVARMTDGRDVFVATDPQGCPQGFIELEPDGHIDRFYCHPAHTRMGMGLALFTRLQDAARTRGIPTLTVEASEPAKRFFEKVGFVTLHRRDFDMRGVRMHNYAMAKDLAP